MKIREILLSTALCAGLSLADLASAQEATPLPPPAGAAAAPPEEPASAILDPSLVANTPAAPADEKRACKRTVFVEEIPYTWDKLEKGTDAAWVAYSNGEFTKAVPLFAKLADLGHPVAEWLMGNVYYFGQGVPLDLRTSLSWFEKAAMQGCFAAYAPTAQMYENGDGTLVDPGKAYMWYNIAVAQLPQGKERREMVERREKVAGLLTPAQLEAAQKRSLQFEPKLIVPPDISELPDDFFKQP
ncbi:tetratricopeptide repeat protein [Dongia mobilis]|jgi:TPR repeat protein|uniref:tetratricopeptide repeat protein n=1 Tax=Dongia sp. TaxID=1977262 RepID=UPI0026EE0730